MDQIQEEVFPSDEEFDDEDDDEESDSSTDVDAKLLEEEVFDSDFLKCYSALKKKDSKIYDKNVKFFEDKSLSESEDEANNKDADIKSENTLLGSINKLPSKPKMTILDHQIKLKDDDLEELRPSETKIDLNDGISKSYYQKELEEIKKSIENVTAEVDSDSDGDFLIVKGSSDSAGQAKPKRAINALLSNMEEGDDPDIKHLKEMWSDKDKLSEEDRFLRDYILNKKYIPEPEDAKLSHFSKDIEKLSDVEDEEEDRSKRSKKKSALRSEESDFDKISRIPRNATQTIRDLNEKREKREKRLKKLQKEKKRKSAIKDEDCEDVVGELRTRFHYDETEPNDYGLSAEEILTATDEELDKWIKLVETMRRRPIEDELRLKRKFDHKRDDHELKKSIFKSIYTDEAVPDIESNVDDKSNSRKRKRKSSEHDDNMVHKGSEDQEVVESDAKHENPDDVKQHKMARKKKHKRGVNHKKFAKVGVAPDRLLAYGLSKTKLRKSNLLPH